MGWIWAPSVARASEAKSSDRFHPSGACGSRVRVLRWTGFPRYTPQLQDQVAILDE